MKRKHLVRLILILLMLVLLPLPLIEHALRGPEVPIIHPQFVASPPAEAFDEQQAFIRALHDDPSGLFWIPGDAHGQYFNATSGIRRTVGQPSTWTNTVYLVGPSTVIDVYNTDEYTIASQLQRLLPSLRVVNLGTQGGLAGVQYARLASVTLEPGDVVIFYSGLMESHIVAMQQIDHVRQQYAASPCGWMTRWFDSLATVRAACRWYVDPAVPESTLLEENQKVLQSFQYFAAKMRAMTMNAHASFVWVLGPYLQSKPLSPYERAVATIEGHMSMTSALIAHRLCDQTLADQTLNLAHVLDAYRASGHEVFYEAWHVSGDANAIIARAIYDYLVQTI